MARFPWHVLIFAAACAQELPADAPTAAQVIARVDHEILRARAVALDEIGDLQAGSVASARLVDYARASVPEELADALLVHARIAFKLGRWSETEAAAAEGLEHVDERALRGEMLAELGSVHLERRQPDKAIPVLQEALAIAEEVHGKESKNASDAVEALAIAFDYATRYAEAEAGFRSAERLAERNSGRDSADVARIRANLALNLEYQERDKDALGLYQSAVPMLEKVVGYERNSLAEAYAGMARIYRRRDDLRAAERMFRASLDVRRGALGDAHPLVAMDHYNLAIVLDDLGRVADALAECTTAEAIRRTALTPDHPHRVETETLCRDLRDASARRGPPSKKRRGGR